eukprot:9493248-Pyramimonas_sp.AAC.1
MFRNGSICEGPGARCLAEAPGSKTLKNVQISGRVGADGCQPILSKFFGSCLVVGHGVRNVALADPQ